MTPRPPYPELPEQDVVAPTREDPLVTWASEGVGGPRGARAADGGSWWTPVRVLVVLVVLASGLGVLAKQHCRAEGWSTPDQFVHVCYSDIPHLFIGRGLDRGAVPYLDEAGAEPVEYPVLTGAVLWGTAALVPDDVEDRSLRFFDINVILLALSAVVVVVATARTVRRRPWDAAIVAVAPVLVLTGTINWDLWAVALTALALLAWSRERTVTAGVLLGLATAAKFYPLLLLGPLLVLCLRAGKLRDFGAALGAAVLAWTVVNLPVLIADPAGWSYFYTFSRDRPAGFSSPWYTLDLLGSGVPPERLNAVSSGLFLLCCLVIGALGLLAPRRPRLHALCFLTVAAFLLTNKVYSPQFVLWLLPLAALARPRWRDIGIWQVGQVVHFVGIWYHLVGFSTEDRGLPDAGYAWTVAAHLAGTLWLVGVVVRDTLLPEHDPVRLDGSDDPGGGVLDSAPDAHPPPLRALRRWWQRRAPSPVG